VYGSAAYRARRSSAHRSLYVAGPLWLGRPADERVSLATSDRQLIVAFGSVSKHVSVAIETRRPRRNRSRDVGQCSMRRSLWRYRRSWCPSPGPSGAGAHTSSSSSPNSTRSAAACSAVRSR
jgi:hypothetical protein